MFDGLPLEKEAEKGNEDYDDHVNDAGINVGEKHVSHAYYRELIAKGFEKRAPSRQAPNNPAYFPIDVPVTRTLTTSKYSAKATENSIAVANLYFCLCD